MRIARNAFASVGQVALISLIQFVIYRKILLTLGAAELGIWSIVLATVGASKFGELGLSASVTRFVAKYQATGEIQKTGCLVQTATISVVMLFAAILIIAYPLLTLLFDAVIPPAGLDEAHHLLPYALASLLLAATGGIFQSTLDGYQHYDRRALLVVTGQLAYFFAALWLTPRLGLTGLAWAQILQGLFLIVVGWIAIRRVVAHLPWFPWQWKTEVFREVIGYGLQFQFGSIAMMLFDPITKALLGKYGGLASAGYFEMANQFVLKSRQLIISANQVLIPVAAELNENDPGALRNLYQDNLRILFFFVLPLYALVAAWAPLLSDVLIGHSEPQFIYFVNISVIAWVLNTFNIPAYFFNLGTGRIFWNTVTHVSMGVLNAVFGIALGVAFGAKGVACGMALAIVLSSAIVVNRFHHQYRISYRLLLPIKSMPLLVIAVLAVVSVGQLRGRPLFDSRLANDFLCLCVPMLVLAAGLWIHPDRRFVQSKMFRR